MRDEVTVAALAHPLLRRGDKGGTMKFIRKDQIPLTLLGLVMGGTIIVTASECTGNHPDSSGASWLAPPPIPAALQIPGGGAASHHFHGKGAQIYTCTSQAPADGSTGGMNYAWTLKGPDAKLFDADGNEIGTHTVGPMWTSLRDGSWVVGSKTAQVDAPITGAIPWLLLQGKSWSGTGVFSRVAFIQRVNTTGGVAPPSGCDATTVNTDVSVFYEADYFFYDPAAGADGAAT